MIFRLAILTLFAVAACQRPSGTPGTVYSVRMEVEEGWNLDGDPRRATFDEPESIDVADFMLVPMPDASVRLIGWQGARVFEPFKGVVPPVACEGLREVGMVAPRAYVPNTNRGRSERQLRESFQGEWYCVRTGAGATAAVHLSGPLPRHEQMVFAPIYLVHSYTLY